MNTTVNFIKYFDTCGRNIHAIKFGIEILMTYYKNYRSEYNHFEQLKYTNGDTKRDTFIELYLKYFDKFLVEYGTSKNILDEIQANFRQININNTTCKQIVYIWTYVNLKTHTESVIYVGSTMRTYCSRFNSTKFKKFNISYKNFEETYKDIYYFYKFFQKHSIDIQNNFKLYCFEANDVLDNKNGERNSELTSKLVRQIESDWITKLLKSGNPLLNVRMEGNVSFNISLA